jgi:FkbM family methyltransferase
MLDYTNFDWGWMDEHSDIIISVSENEVFPLGEFHKRGMIQEIFTNFRYEKYFGVEQGDIVVDIGASVGPFTYSILHKKPKHVFCLEPSEREMKTLVRNTLGFPVTHINKGISDKNSIVDTDMMFGGESQMESVTFQKFINLYGLEKIDFLKTDCEGGEYHIFTHDNLGFIKNKISTISGEWNLKTPEEKIKFKKFRDNILPNFNNFQVNSVDGVDIKWDLWNEHFLDYYKQIYLFIDNRR